MTSAAAHIFMAWAFVTGGPVIALLGCVMFALGLMEAVK